MPSSPIGVILQQLRKLGLRDAENVSDGQLLERFCAHGDQTAFEALLLRHGAMVLGACQRILHNAHDTEDVFQATFLVLVRKARSLLGRKTIGNWLHEVASRTALKARTAACKRRVKEKQVKTISLDQADEGWRELQTFLDQELQRLPAKYSGPIVLCDLEGKTRKQAARQLGWREGTFSSRLSRGRALLAKRLSRHGVVVSGGVLAAILCRNAASACMPAGLVPATVQAATLMAAGKALATGAISAKVAALTEGVLKAMLMTKIKVAIAVVMTLNLIGASVGLVYCQTAGSGQPGKGQPVTAQKQQPTAKADGKDEEKKDEKQDSPKTVQEFKGEFNLAFHTIKMEEGKSYRITVKATGFKPILWTVTQLPQGTMLGYADKMGNDFHQLVITPGKTFECQVRVGQDPHSIFEIPDITIKGGWEYRSPRRYTKLAAGPNPYTLTVEKAATPLVRSGMPWADLVASAKNAAFVQESSTKKELTVNEHSAKLTEDKIYLVTVKCKRTGASLWLLDGDNIVADGGVFRGGPEVGRTLKLVLNRSSSYRILVIPDQTDIPAPLEAAPDYTMQFAEAKTELAVKGELTANEPKKVHTVKLQADKTYQIDMTSTPFNGYLILEDSAQKILMQRGDEGGERKGPPRHQDPSIVFRPTKTDTYRITATTKPFPSVKGAYSLSVFEYPNAQPMSPQPGGPVPLPEAIVPVQLVPRLEDIPPEPPAPAPRRAVPPGP